MKISIIIPTYNEEKLVASTIRTIKEKAGANDRLEIIVADGGSTDRTISRARKEGARIIHCSATRRSIQMNEGARAASKEVLYFLHADTQPPVKFDQIILDKLQAGFWAGCFRLSFDSTHPLLRLYGWCTRFNINAFRFGDQSLFVHREVFEKIGAFKDNYILLEGHNLITRLKRAYPFIVCNQHVITSARKYKTNGPMRLQIIYALIFMLYKLGLSQIKLHSIFKKWVR